MLGWVPNEIQVNTDFSEKGNRNDTFYNINNNNIVATVGGVGIDWFHSITIMT